MAPDNGALLAALGDIIAEQRETNRLLCALLDRGTSRPALRRGDMQALRRLLPVLGDQFAGVRFSCWEVTDAAEADAGIAGKNLKLALRGLDARALGRLFERAVNRNVNGLTIERDGRDGNGVLWRVANASPFTER
jgi:hypothetical protein